MQLTFVPHVQNIFITMRIFITTQAERNVISQYTRNYQNENIINDVSLQVERNGDRNEAKETERLEFQSSMHDTQILLQTADVYSSVIA